MNPLYPLDHCFWDVEKLRDEAFNVKSEAQKFPYTYKGKDFGVITALPLLYLSFLPALEQFRDSFLETYPGDWGEFTTSYMWVDSEYPWHVDNETTKRDNVKGVNCAINILLTGEDNPVEFEGYGKQIYEAAVLNTSHLHRVIPAEERTMARLSFKDLTYKEVVKGIEEWQRKSI
jgi:hypothetical protein|tara:strand:+ start:2018 stop:2542 length:525 start_codon:yes stop_codon:yes gene_type:complete